MRFQPYASLALILAVVSVPATATAQSSARMRARAAGIVIGRLPPGPLNTITDVAGVQVGHATIVEGDSVRSGVTAILPHTDNVYFSRPPAAIVVGNGFGKLLGSTQVNELGELETPILLTCTLCVWRAADAMVELLLAAPGMDRVRSINPVVGETNDGFLNAIRSRPILPSHVHDALASATGGPVAEGSVGAGTGTIAFGWKGGIGTASRLVDAADSTWTVGVLVQSNFGGDLTVAGEPVWRTLRPPSPTVGRSSSADGSVLIVIATDAPLSHRNLRRLAARTLMGLGRTGSYASNGSGDYVIAFSTAREVRRDPRAARQTIVELNNDEMSGLFQAAAEGTEEAVLNSLFMATAVESRNGRIEAIPIEAVRRLLRH